ncbi:hypothetical protein [Sphingomonas sp. PP-CE-1A-559]|uniref:hypothetical protein n=1 Tax=Sphingomonas sp. PP-CE-1A-559 TaxID=2135657 RepID=UPI0010546E65|nr:hypothetical protein [Sphingomonas sp. PP-CE-1A-559]
MNPAVTSSPLASMRNMIRGTLKKASSPKPMGRRLAISFPDIMIDIAESTIQDSNAVRTA